MPESLQDANHIASDICRTLNIDPKVVESLTLQWVGGELPSLTLVTILPPTLESVAIERKLRRFRLIPMDDKGEISA